MCSCFDMNSIQKVFVSVCTRAKFGIMDKKIKHDSLKIFQESVSAVSPQNLIKSNVQLNENNLVICNKQYVVNRNCYIVGFGKAVYKMSLAMESILRSHLACGIVSVPLGTFDSESRSNISRIDYIEGARNNLPDLKSQAAARQISELAEELNKDDLLIVLISGGGSALLPLPKAPITLKEKTDLIKLLSRRGADIKELNCVRKRLSVLKGGGLAEKAYPANVVSLILSDVIGDPLDCIASGPTCLNNDSPDDAMKIVEKYASDVQLADSIRSILQSEDSKIEPERFIHVTNFVIGNNRLAALKAKQKASELGYQTCVISLAVSGDVSAISCAFARIGTEIAKAMKGLSSRSDLLKSLRDLQTVLTIPEEAITELMSLDLSAGAVCLISGGEPTVRVSGQGKGGRNQQLALQFAISVNDAVQLLKDGCDGVNRMNISLLSCGTDGFDGPTDAAGAIGFLQLCPRAQQHSIDPLDYVHRNDSYNFYKLFENSRYLIKTGHTGTNVMDIHVLIVSDHLIKSKY